MRFTHKFIQMQIKLIFALGIVLKQRQKATRKWPIEPINIWLCNYRQLLQSVFLFSQLSLNLRIVPTNAALHLVRMLEFVSTDTMTTYVHVKLVIQERTARQVKISCIDTGLTYSKNPRITIPIFPRQVEMVLIYWMSSEKSGCLGSSIGSYYSKNTACCCP